MGYTRQGGLLEPNRDQIEIFTEALFRYAKQGFVSVRAFYEDGGAKAVFRISATPLTGGLKFLIDVAEDDARRAANDPRPVVFCPPIATFCDGRRATARDIVEGLALTVECDEHPQEARARLERILGLATLVVRSGGLWTDPQTEVKHDKLHLHWRLAAPAVGNNLSLLTRARKLATALVGGDPSNVPIVHPIRWPGSWHRKGEPRLCEIETTYPDREVVFGVGGRCARNRRNRSDKRQGSRQQRAQPSRVGRGLPPNPFRRKLPSDAGSSGGEFRLVVRRRNRQRAAQLTDQFQATRSGARAPSATPS